jgi:hypothetical protein
MRFHYSAAALALITTSAHAQECPAGYEKTKGLTWVPCGEGSTNTAVECATLEVPVDWNSPSGEKMKLQLIRQPASTDKATAKSVILNPGGPGESGIETVVEGGTMWQQ